MGLKRFAAVLLIYVSVLSMLTLCEGKRIPRQVDNPDAIIIKPEVVSNLKSTSDETEGIQEKQAPPSSQTNTAFTQASAKCELLPAPDLPSSYFLCPESLNWFMASRHCQQLGMSLPVINSKPVYDNLVRNLKDIVGQYYGRIPGFWIGGTDLGSERNFYWYPNGEPMTFTPIWGSGEPNNDGGNENCMNLVNYAITDPRFLSEFPFYSNDTFCYNSNLRVLCQLD